MQCPQCGATLAPGDEFCPSCGTDVRAVTQPVPSPAPPDAPAPPPIAAPTPPESIPPQKSGTPAGVVIGVVVGALALIALVGVGAFYGFQMLTTAPKAPVVSATTVAPQPVASTAASAAASTAVSPVASVPATSSSAKAPSGPTGMAVSTAGSAASGTGTKGKIVTDAEARAVVKKFWDYRIGGQLAASKKLCSKNMLTGENGSFVNDKNWRPDTYKIVKTTPDLAYVQVAIMGDWPSGRAPTILSVRRDPSSGKVLIDGTINPASRPELYK